MSSRHQAGTRAQPGPAPASVSSGAKILRLVAILLGAGLLFGASLAPAAGLAAGLVHSVDSGVFDHPPLPDDLGEPWQRSVILDRDGGELTVIRDENRTVVDLHEVPVHVQDAVLATEDAGFRDHGGIDWRAIARAATSNVTAGEVTSGGSTITQQLVKNVVLGSDQTLDRKVQEAIYAIELEQHMSKDEILEAYLNEAYFGNRTYGIATAAEFYWGKDVEELTLAEGALLAGVIRAPTRNDPAENPDRALARRNIVLAQMARAGFVDEADAARAQTEPLELDVHELTEPDEPVFVNHVRRELLDKSALGETTDDRERVLRRGGLEIDTTLDPALQELAGEVIADHLDSSDDPLGALTTVDPATGEVLALGVGARDFSDFQVNVAARGGGGSAHDAGSAYKPFMLVAALQQGLHPGYTYAAGEAYEFEQLGCEEGYAPRNFGGASHGTLDMAEATAISSNVYFVHLLDEVGIEALVDALQRAGVPVDDDDAQELIDGPVCSLVLGAAGEAGGVYPLEMASAYGTFANEGQHCEPYAVKEIRDREGQTVSSTDSHCHDAFSSDIARQVTGLLQGPLESGTASEHGQIDRPAAGKTGTTQDSEDAWFAGYVPQLSTSVWVGHPDSREVTHPLCDGAVTGGCLPTMMWQQYMSGAVEILELKAEDFPDPPPVPESNVPGVAGMTEDDAVATLEGAGFRASVDTTGHWAPAGTVLRQSPDGGASAAEGSRVTVAVSDGSAEAPTVPQLVGLHAGAARDQLAAADLVHEERLVPVDDSAQYDQVVAQSPGPGTAAYADDGLSQVGILVEVGRPRTEGEAPPETAPADGHELEDEQGEVGE